MPPYFWALSISITLLCITVGVGLTLALSRNVSLPWRMLGFFIVILFITSIVTITLNH